MGWLDEVEQKKKEEFEEGFFNIAEGDNRIQLLTHCAPLAQVWNAGTKKYEVAEEGAKGVSIKGVCWVLQEEKIKQAKLPYTVVKAIRALQLDQDWAFTDYPMPRQINIKARGAGTKEVEYSVVPSPKETKVSKEVMDELAQKPTPEEIIEKIKGKVSQAKNTNIPQDDINPDDIPF